MARAWIVDGRLIAKKVKHPTGSSEEIMNDNEVQLKCPCCRFNITNSDIEYEWPGLPLGVKFDPTDVELLQHLSAKCGFRSSKPHPLIDEFIPTLKEETGICYTHPENLPGVKKDGSAVHFFHKTANAYPTGQRKRRKIQNDGGVRWHKTGKTRSVIDDNGVEKGFKKIMVLQKTDKKESRNEKSKWVAHEYHLGSDKDEDDNQFVLSKVFFQKDNEQIKEARIAENFNDFCHQNSPRIPNPNPPWLACPLFEADGHVSKMIEELKGEPDELKYQESQAVEISGFGEDDDLLFPNLLEQTITGEPSNEHCNISELENLDFDFVTSP